MVESPAFFDDVELLRVMFRLHQEGRLAYMTGDQLMQELGGSVGHDSQRAAFVQTLHVAAQDGLLGFELIPPLGTVAPLRPDEYQYLANLRNFHLRTAGLDRAQGQRIVLHGPEPGQDDGRRLPIRVIEQVAAAMARELHGSETRLFLLDSDIPPEHCPEIGPNTSEALYLRTVLLHFLGRGASGRRVVRALIGRWLSDDLDIGPSDEEREVVLRALGRAGWQLKDSVLVTGEKVKPPRETSKGEPDRQFPPADAAKARRVMLVYGRDTTASRAVFDFLRALSLEPQEWIQLVRATGSGTPYTGEVLDSALEIVQAVVVLFTPDDEARLRADLIRPDDPPAEGQLQGQPRPNVLFEAGLAFGRHRRRTILVEHGQLRGISDLFGRHSVQLGSTSEPLHDLAQRLQHAGCAVDTSGSQWLDPLRFTTPPQRSDKSSADQPRNSDSLERLISEIMTSAVGETPAADVVAAVAHRLRTVDGEFDSSGLLRALPGRQLAIEEQKRITSELHSHGALRRNPHGRGWVVGDLPP